MFLEDPPNLPGEGLQVLAVYSALSQVLQWPQSVLTTPLPVNRNIHWNKIPISLIQSQIPHRYPCSFFSAILPAVQIAPNIHFVPRGEKTEFDVKYFL